MIFLDKDYKCHATNPDSTLRGFDVPFFDGKCQAFVDGYRYVPANETWTREDGTVFTGEMIAPCKDYNLLASAQAQYEADQAELAAAYQEGVDSV